MKASELMFGLVLTVGIMAIIGAFFSSTFIINGVTLSPEFNNTITTMKDINSTSRLIYEQKEKALLETNTTTSKNIVSEYLDIVGFWFEKGFVALKLIPKSMELASNMFTVGLESIGGALGIAFEPIRFIVVGLLTLAVLFFIVAVVIKWDV